MKVKGERFTVVGAGRSGIAAANLLATRGADVLLVEHTERDKPDTVVPSVRYRAGTNTPRKGDCVVLSPGISEVSPVRKMVADLATEVLGEVELFSRLCPGTILAITGTDGKSTTTTMLGAICEATTRPTFVGGNLGNPLCEGLDGLSPESLVVAEISAFQLTTCSRFRPRVAIVTNIAEDHVDYHGSFERYEASKRIIFEQMGAGDVLILNSDDARIAKWTLPEGPTILYFSTKDEQADAYFDGKHLIVREGTHHHPLMSRAELPLLGRHNVANALAAALAARAVAVPMETISCALASYTALPHRLAPIRTLNGVQWVNDSKATNPNAAMAGIEAIEGPVIALCGGSEKDASFGAFGALLKARAKLVVTFGTTRGQIADAIDDPQKVKIVETLNEAVSAAHLDAVTGDTVVLSPACASFDQFESYGHRGRVFEALVASLE